MQSFQTASPCHLFFCHIQIAGHCFFNICHNIVGRVFGFPFLFWQKQHLANGKEVLGKYIQLAVTYSNDDKVLSLESCNACADNVVSTRKVNIEKSDFVYYGYLASNFNLRWGEKLKFMVFKQPAET
jgi:hypothetical protein